MRPLGNRVLLEIEPKQEATKGGILVPESALMSNHEIGIVTAAGDECKYVKVGDRAVLGVYTGTNITVDGNKYLILKETDILAVADKKK